MGKPEGWYYIVGARGEKLAHNCTLCGCSHVIGTDSPARVWCCGQWKTPPEESFWAGNLPRVVSQAPQRGLTLPGKVISFTE